MLATTIRHRILRMKVALKVVLSSTLLFVYICVFLYCEHLIYYLVLVQCDWPQLDPKNEDPRIETTNEEPLQALVITDIHLLGTHEGYWLDKIRTDWEMHMAFQTALKLHRPEIVFVLGDLTHEGQYSSNAEFSDYVRRFYDLFANHENIPMYILAGNHDIGFHNQTAANLTRRFEKGFNAPAVQFLTVQGNHFVLVNSVTLEGDGCSLCNATEHQLAKVENTLKCTKGEINCDSTTKLKSYSKPILLQHFPLYRESDENCSEPDEAPFPEKIEKFVEAWDCLSKTATKKLLGQISPRLVMAGHTHHGCTRDLPDGEGIEITIASFNRRNKDRPSYGLVVLTPNNYAFSKCLMPRESTGIIRYVFGVSCLILGMMYCGYRSKRWKRRYFMLA